MTITADDLRARVYLNLDAAKENEYLGSDGTPMHDWTDEDIEADMLAFAADVEDCNVGELVPHIHAWREINDKG